MDRIIVFHFRNQRSKAMSLSVSGSETYTCTVCIQTNMARLENTSLFAYSRRVPCLGRVEKNKRDVHPFPFRGAIPSISLSFILSGPPFSRLFKGKLFFFFQKNHPHVHSFAIGPREDVKIHHAHSHQLRFPNHVRINSANLGNAAIFSSGLVVSAKKMSRWFLSFLLFFSSLGAASLVTSLMRSSTELEISPLGPGGNAPGGGAPKPGRGGSAPGWPGILPGRVGMAALPGEKGCAMP